MTRPFPECPFDCDPRFRTEPCTAASARRCAMFVERDRLQAEGRRLAGSLALLSEADELGGRFERDAILRRLRAIGERLVVTRTTVWGG